jgi:hypothetical protein
MPGSSYLVDTNILLRLVQPDSPEYGTIRECADRLWARGAELFYTSQNLAEFWNVCIWPADRNWFGSSVAETDERAALIEAKFSLAAESEATQQEWRRIVVAAKVSGIQVHDALGSSNACAGNREPAHSQCQGFQPVQRHCGSFAGGGVGFPRLATCFRERSAWRVLVRIYP